MKKTVEKIAAENGRFSPRGLEFVYEGLGYTVKKLTEEQDDKPVPHHISGRKLCEGLRQQAIEKWGRLAKVVLNHWGIKTTRDFGEIVYLMIEHKWMSAQPQDSIDDFNDIYNFKTVFEDKFKFDITSKTSK